MTGVLYYSKVEQFKRSSCFMDFFQLGANGYGTYYPPAVRSMMDNWHNFFFASYDPGGFVTVDKPPVGFWFDVLSTREHLEARRAPGLSRAGTSGRLVLMDCGGRPYAGL